MLSLLTLIVIISMSLLITRVATIMLNHTGLSREAAAFQARSAFTGVGFTTFESETVVHNPVRRKIIMTLMLIGNAGIISVMATLILTFVNNDEAAIGWPVKMAILIGSLIILWMISRSSAFDKWLCKIIERALKRYTTLYIHDYASLFHFSEDYQLFEYRIKENDWLTSKSLRDLKLRDEGLNLIGISRANGTYIGTPKGDTIIEPGDKVVMYGRKNAMARIEKRDIGWEGEKDHKEAVLRQQERLREQEAKEQQRKYQS